MLTKRLYGAPQTDPALRHTSEGTPDGGSAIKVGLRFESHAAFAPVSSFTIDSRDRDRSLNLLLPNRRDFPTKLAGCRSTRFGPIQRRADLQASAGGRLSIQYDRHRRHPDRVLAL